MIMGAAGAIAAMICGYSFWIGLAIYSGIGCATAMVVLLIACLAFPLRTDQEDTYYPALPSPSPNDS